MTAFDFAMLAIAAASMLLGLWRGIVSEILALVAWIAAFFAARMFATDIAAGLTAAIKEPALQYAAGFAIVFFGVLLIFTLFRVLLKTLLKVIGLGAVDRVLGGVFGAARALLILVALTLAGGLTTLPQQPWWREAKLSPPLETAVLALKPWLPAAIVKRIKFR